jgi:arabinan endo-1,5-alpha-L-arabinosidase
MIQSGHRLAALACALPLCAGAAAPASSTATYTNPLPVRLAGGELAENCADPAVLRDPRARKPTWYLYCTSDPVSKKEGSGHQGDGGWKFRMMPVYRSSDLVHWDFVADAFTDRPQGLAAPTSGLWAPEPVFMNGRYYLYFTVTDVADAHSPEPGCGTDSAIGVATAASPAGPWRASGAPVVAPQRAGPGCAFHWVYDPKVVVDGERKYLYYGSYGGGIWVRKLDDDGMAVHGDAVRVGADGRYEGTDVVKHEGWWYMFASATNCCNGPLTGYGVFVGRARTPEGPFLDRYGNDMAKGRAGGTPFLLQNGNRWVGPGHNTVFTDAAGQWWTIYHAIDLHQPFFSAKDKLTRRLAMLERIDWVDGWPAAGGGTAPNDGPMAAPLVTAGAKAPAAPLPAPLPDEQAVPLWTDTLRDPRLDERWQWLRPRTDGALAATADARGLVLPVEPGDLYVDTNTASVLQTALPRSGDYRIEAELELEVDPGVKEGGSAQAGLVVMRDDDNYVKLVELARGGLRQVEFGKEVAPVAPDWPRYGNTLAGTPGRHTWLRLDVRRDGDQERYTAYSSQDGRAWVGGAVWTHRLDKGSTGNGRAGTARLGLVAMGGAGRALFTRVAVSGLSRQIYDSHERGRKALPAPPAPR